MSYPGGGTSPSTIPVDLGGAAHAVHQAAPSSFPFTGADVLQLVLIVVACFAVAGVMFWIAYGGRHAEDEQ